MQCKKCKQHKPSAEFKAKQGSRFCKLCARCRSLADARCKKYKGKHPKRFASSVEKYLGSTKNEARAKRAQDKRHTPEERKRHAEKAAEHRKTEEYAEYIQSPSFKESRKRSHQKAFAEAGAKAKHYLLVAIGDTLGERRADFSNKLATFSEFTNASDVRTHFESQFEDWMNWENHSHRGWNIGHRIARAMYGASDEDIRRCYMKANLFPQKAMGADGNCALHTKLPPEEELVLLRSCWPVGWMNVLPSKAERARMEHAMYVKHKA